MKFRILEIVFFSLIITNLFGQFNGTGPIYTEDDLVGIGTATPSEKLEILGGKLKLTSPDNGTYARLYAKNDGNIVFGRNTIDYNINITQYGYINLKSTHGAYGVLIRSPNGTLHTNLLTSNTGDFYIGQSNNPFIFVEKDNYNIGIGTTAPSHRLHLKSNTSEDALRIAGPYGNFDHGARFNFGDADYVYLEEDKDDHLYIHAASRTAIMGGNVGIDTDDPNNRLTVRGNVAIGYDYGAGDSLGGFSAPWNGMIVEGFVGIGTNSPVEQLHVAGNLRLDGKLIFSSSDSIKVKSQLDATAKDLVIAGGNGIEDQNVSDGGSIKILGGASDGDGGLGGDVVIDGGKGDETDGRVVLAKNTGIVQVGNVSLLPGAEENGTKMYVEGNIRMNGKLMTGEVFVAEDPIEEAWPDYVFEKDYNLMSLKELNEFIKTNKHLPEIPTANEIYERKMVNLGQMNKLLLKKVEEMSLYLIEMDKQNETLNSRLLKLESNHE